MEQTWVYNTLAKQKLQLVLGSPQKTYSSVYVSSSIYT